MQWKSIFGYQFQNKLEWISAVNDDCSHLHIMESSSGVATPMFPNANLLASLDNKDCLKNKKWYQIL